MVGKIFVVLFFGMALSFANIIDPVVAEPTTASNSVILKSDSANVKPDSTMNLAQEETRELLWRDSLLASKDSLLEAERQAHRTAMETETARCENWEKSYNTVQTEFATCAKMLSVSVENLEKNKEREAEEFQKTMMMQTSSFIGGILLGMLIYWLAID